MSAPVPAIAITVGGGCTFKTIASNVGTIETTSAHGLTVGSIVTLAGVDATFNGSRTITAVPDSKTFKFALTAGDVARTAATGTVTPTTIVLTPDVTEVNVTAVESGSHSPAATARQWKVGGTNIANGDQATEVLTIRRAGAPVALTCQVTNGDVGGPVTSSAVNITVTDSVVSTYGTPSVQSDGTTRVNPTLLPYEYRDPRYATPGLPTAAELANARTNLTILPTASQPLAATAA